MYPFCHGFGGDLMFYIAIDALFLTTAKGFTEAQFLTMAAISTTISLLLRLPILWLAKQLGNTLTLRIGAASLLASALLITFGNSFFIIVIGRCLRFVNTLSADICRVSALENNLIRLDREKHFLPIRANGSLCYSALTLGISLVAATMFNIDPYLPMYGCIACAATSFVLSLFTGDFSGDLTAEKGECLPKGKLRLAPYLLLLLLCYGISYSVISNGISDNKLFMQQVFLESASLQQTANLIGMIYFLSRVVRFFSNLFFVRLYHKIKLKIGFVIWVAAIAGFALTLAGAFLPGFWTKVVVMGAGYVVMLYACDPTKLYIQQVIAQYTPHQQHLDLFAYMGLSFSVFTALFSVLSSFVLGYFPLAMVPALLLVSAVLSLLLLIVLYKQLQKRTPVTTV